VLYNPAPAVAIIEKDIQRMEWDRWSWVYRTNPSTDSLPPPVGFILNIRNLFTWGEDRIGEYNSVIDNLGLQARLEWHMALKAETYEYLLRLWAVFGSDRDAVAFRLAWEPESLLIGE
jgi:hypothetical protein